jgi:hypothetical protein
MGGNLARTEIEEFLEKLSDHYHHPAKLYLLGGGALCFLGSLRRTLDIDCTTEHPTEDFNDVLESVADSLHLDVELVSINEFIPLPKEPEARHKLINRYGSIDVYVFDPYSIALSKLARGFDTDIQDVVFLLNQEIIELDPLSKFVEDALPEAWNYDIDPKELLKSLEIVLGLLC